MAFKEMGCSYGTHNQSLNLLLHENFNEPNDKLSPFQRQKVDHLFHVLYDISNDKTISRQDFFQLSQKLKELRGWEDGKELRQAQMMINRMWTCLLRGNRKYRTNDLQMHMRRSEWRRYWGDFIEAAVAHRGWPNNCLDNIVDYSWQQEYMRFMFILMDTNGDMKIDVDEYTKCFTSFGVSPQECMRCWERFSVAAKGGRGADCVEFEVFEQLWFQYLTSDNMADPGNYIMGKTNFTTY